MCLQTDENIITGKVDQSVRLEMLIAALMKL